MEYAGFPARDLLICSAMDIVQDSTAKTITMMNVLPISEKSQEKAGMQSIQLDKADVDDF